MGIVPILEMYGVVVAVLIIVAAAATVVGIVWLVRKLIKRVRG